MSTATLPTLEYVEVTPEIAKEWLTRNIDNRPMKQQNIESYSRDMDAGRWRVSTETIKFDTTGKLIDGQNRLRAVIMSGATVLMLIARELDENVQVVLDTGVTRSAGDGLTFAGHREYAAPQAALARFALARDKGWGTKAGDSRPTAKFSNQEIIAWVNQHPLAKWAAMEAAKTASKIGIAPTVWGYAIMAFYSIDSGATRTFIDSLSEYQTDGVGDPRNAMLTALSRKAEGKRMISNGAQLYLVFRTWNLWRAGDKVRTIPINPESTIPTPQ